jgi:hypothetical protein
MLNSKLDASYCQLEELTNEQIEPFEVKHCSMPCLAENLAADSDDSESFQGLYIP